MRSSQFYCIEGELQNVEYGEEYGRRYCDITVDGQRIHMARNARGDKWGVREGDWCLVTVNDRGDGCLVGISILMLHCRRDGRYFSQEVREVET